MTVAPDEDPEDDARAEVRPAGEALGLAVEAAPAVGPINDPDLVNETVRAPVVVAPAPAPADAVAVEVPVLRMDAAAMIDPVGVRLVGMEVAEAVLAPAPGVIERTQVPRETGRPARPGNLVRR